MIEASEEPLPDKLTRELLESQVVGKNLFDSKSWKLSPDVFSLSSPRALTHLQHIGEALDRFQSGLDKLYRCAREDAPLPGTPSTAWVADYYERGKPPWIPELVRRKEPSAQAIMRPDLLLTEHGLALTEIDSLPGGIGLTEFLYQSYESLLNTPCRPSGQSLLEDFYRASARLSEKPDPLIAILYNDEGDTYWPEFDWLAAQLRAAGKRVQTAHVKDVRTDANRAWLERDGESLTIDVVYRFFELYDPTSEKITRSLDKLLAAGRIRMTPPLHFHLEEKLGLALFWHPRLQAFWQDALSRRERLLLSRLIPRSWIVDRVGELPPAAALWSPGTQGKAVQDWNALKTATRKDRALIIKVSGFHENAWGARSVTLGSDVSVDSWAQVLDNALEESDRHLYVMQEFRKPAAFPFRAFDEDGHLHTLRWRVRLCPYYTREDKGVKLAGALATLCPQDKKIIHGMKDACLLPMRMNAAKS